MSQSRSRYQLPLNFVSKGRYPLLLLALVASLTGSILFSLSKQLQAKNVPNQPVEIASTWQNASFPLENFQTYTSPYGYRISPINGQRQFHRGLDMAAPLGSYVRNWWAGQVVSLSDHTGCGTMIKISSGPWTHHYCHLMGRVQISGNRRYLIDRQGGILLWEGQQVPAGARIARVGMTGRTTGPHLHWELLYGGQYIDPALVLRQMYAQRRMSRLP